MKREFSMPNNLEFCIIIFNFHFSVQKSATSVHSKIRLNLQHRAAVHQQAQFQNLAHTSGQHRTFIDCTRTRTPMRTERHGMATQRSNCRKLRKISYKNFNKLLKFLLSQIIIFCFFGDLWMFFIVIWERNTRLCKANSPNSIDSKQLNFYYTSRFNRFKENFNFIGFIS